MKKKTGEICEQIRNAYVSLMENKSYDKIRVREIAEAAHIQRSTFYQYYDNLNDLITSLEEDLLRDMVFYRDVEFDIRKIEPLDSIRDWFDWCMKKRRYLMALMGENGDPYFEEKFKSRICADINRMMDSEGMPRDELRPFCVELTYSIHVSLMKFAVRLGEERCPFRADELAGLSNYWRECALKAEQEQKFPLSGKNKKSE